MNLNNLFDLSGQVVILVGASGLLGKRYSELLSKAGANIVLADLNFSECKKLESDLRKKFDVNPLAIKVDITKKQSIKDMVKKTMKQYSKIDVYFHLTF